MTRTTKQTAFECWTCNDALTGLPPRPFRDAESAAYHRERLGRHHDVRCPHGTRLPHECRDGCNESPAPQPATETFCATCRNHPANLESPEERQRPRNTDYCRTLGHDVRPVNRKVQQ